LPKGGGKKKLKFRLRQGKVGNWEKGVYLRGKDRGATARGGVYKRGGGESRRAVDDKGEKTGRGKVIVNTRVKSKNWAELNVQKQKRKHLTISRSGHMVLYSSRKREKVGRSCSSEKLNY